MCNVYCTILKGKEEGSPLLPLSSSSVAAFIAVKLLLYIGQDDGGKTGSGSAGNGILHAMHRRMDDNNGLIRSEGRNFWC